jgi:hypothetical protein
LLVRFAIENVLSAVGTLENGCDGSGRLSGARRLAISLFEPLWAKAGGTDAREASIGKTSLPFEQLCYKCIYSRSHPVRCSQDGFEMGCYKDIYADRVISKKTL